MKRILFAVLTCALAATMTAAAPVQAATCTDHMVDMKNKAHAVLSTMTYWARPGQEDVIYKALQKQNRILAAAGAQTFDLYRGPGGSGPAAFWTMEQPNMAAHGKWFDKANKVLPDDPAMDAAVLKASHAHYVFDDGWTDSPTCK